MSASKFVSATALLVAGAVAAPSDNFDLSNFKLSTPINQVAFFGADAVDEFGVTVTTSGVAEIFADACEPIPAFDGLALDVGFEDEEFFFSGDDGAMVFRTALDGSADGPDKSTWRSELREQIDGECISELANWSPEGLNVLEATLSVVEVAEADPQTVVGKILAEGSSKTLVKLQYDGPEKAVRAILNEDPILGGSFSLSFAAIPGTGVFSYSLTLAGDTLTISVTVDGETDTQSVTFGEGNMSDLWNDQVYYFRAGSHPQAAIDIGGAFEVHFTELSISHDVVEGAL